MVFRDIPTPLAPESKYQPDTLLFSSYQRGQELAKIVNTPEGRRRMEAIIQLVQTAVVATRQDAKPQLKTSHLEGDLAAQSELTTEHQRLVDQWNQENEGKTRAIASGQQRPNNIEESAVLQTVFPDWKPGIPRTPEMEKYLQDLNNACQDIGQALGYQNRLGIEAEQRVIPGTEPLPTSIKLRFEGVSVEKVRVAFSQGWESIPPIIDADVTQLPPESP